VLFDLIIKLIHLGHQQVFVGTEKNIEKPINKYLHHCLQLVESKIFTPWLLFTHKNVSIRRHQTCFHFYGMFF